MNPDSGKTWCVWEHGPCTEYGFIKSSHSYQVTDPTDWDNSTEKGEWHDPNLKIREDNPK